ncbi:UNVERIFIED_CONTAM: hypothetical protein Slati_1717300 [Sesamum latifolium]|uniref:RNase H type-1 domain-containing protein n=1 Tax=Sesamum latifolium TaxID=2727402 RepID=A0AAW2WV23_9LAMI
MSAAAGGSSPPSRSYRDAVAGAAVRPPPPSVSFDAALFRPMGMLTRDQGMKILRFTSEEIDRLSKPFRYSLGGVIPELPIQFFDKEALFSIGHLLGIPLQTDVSTATLVRPSVARVCVEINFLEPLQTEVALGFGTEIFIQPVLYERLPKYYGTCKNLGHGEEECYEKYKTKPVRPMDGQGASAPAPILAPARADLRIKLDAQRARRDLNNHRRGKRVVFEVSEARAHPEASSSGSKRDGEEMHDCDGPEIVMKEVRQPAGVVEDGKGGPGDGLHSTPGDDHQEGGTMSEMGQAVHEESTSEPVVQAAAVVREELPGQMRMRWLGGWHATGVVDHGRGRWVCEAFGFSRSWIGNDPTQRVLNRVTKENHLDFLAIMEPMVPLDGRFMARRLGFQDVISNCVNQIWFFWGLDVRCQVPLDHEQLLHLWLESNRWPKPIFLTAVNARCDIVERRHLWDALRTVSVGASPWIVGGDFNTVLSSNPGGAAPSSVAMSDFHDVIADCALVDAGYTGSPYTWYSSRLRQRLDRVLVFSCWMDVFPKMQVTHLELSKSDHRGLLVEAEITIDRKASSFRFQHMWAKHQGFLEVVHQNWQVVEAERNLKEADEAYDLDPCDRTLVERNRCLAELVRALVQEEAFWKQKAGVKWAKDGERNTRYFHSLVTKKRFWGTIFGIQHESEFLTDPMAITSLAASHFQQLLTAEPVFPEEMDMENLEDGLTDEDRRFLCDMPTQKEVRETVFSIEPESVAGPDGFGAFFYHTCWDFVSEDVFGAVTEFFRGVALAKSFTATTISLIPKTYCPASWSEYRPVSLCNVTNKICTMLMTIRLGRVLPKVLSLSQSGFVPGWLLSDNVLLAQELIHSLESRRADANVIFKLDMAKAYDRGDPLSPALFVLAADYLSRGLDRLFAAHPSMYYQAPGRVRVSHLAYADDMMIFTNICSQNIELLQDFLRAYQRVSGQLINNEKSSFIVGRQVSPLQTQAVQTVMGYRLKYLPVTYLGVPLYKKNRKACFFDPIIARIRSMLQGWAMTNLSHGGWLALIKSVLQATPLHQLQVRMTRLCGRGLVMGVLEESSLRDYPFTPAAFGRYLALFLVADNRNAAKYDGVQFSTNSIIFEVHRHLWTLYAAWILTSTQWKGDLHRAMAMGFVFRPTVPRAPRVVRWATPSPAWFKLNSDGSSLGNPGSVGTGGIIRDAAAQVRLAYQVALGTTTSVIAELTAVWRGLELAMAHGLAPIVVEVDATMVIQLLQSRTSGRWEVQHLIMRIVQIQHVLGSDVRHIFSEANGAADHLVKETASLQITRVLHPGDITGALRGILRLDRLGILHLPHG